MTTTLTAELAARAQTDRDLDALADRIDRDDLTTIRCGTVADACPGMEAQITIRREALTAMAHHQDVLGWPLTVALLDRILAHQVPARRYEGWMRIRAAAADPHHSDALLLGVAADVAAHR